MCSNCGRISFPKTAALWPIRCAPDSLHVEINNFYTATVYEKGAELCRMMQTILGEEQASGTAMDLYLQPPRRGCGDSGGLRQLACRRQATGTSTQFFRWYEQAGTPELARFGQLLMT